MSEILVKIPSNFSVEEASRFREDIRKQIEGGAFHFVLDFSDCKFIDSTGLGVIVSSYKKCAENGGKMKLRSLGPNVMKIFELTRLNHVFTIE